jgi:hypothetical protein
MEVIYSSETSVHGSTFQKMITFRTSVCRILPSHLLHSGLLFGCFSELKVELIYSSETSFHGAISQKMTTLRT